MRSHDLADSPSNNKGIQMHIRDAARQAFKEITGTNPDIESLMSRVPEVRNLRNRIDAEDFATPQELADARDCIAHRVGEPQGRFSL